MKFLTKNTKLFFVMLISALFLLTLNITAFAETSISSDSFSVVNHWGATDNSIENAFDSNSETYWESKRSMSTPYIAGAVLDAGDGNAFDLTKVSLVTSKSGSSKQTIKVFGTNDASVASTDFSKVTTDLSKSGTFETAYNATLLGSATDIQDTTNITTDITGDENPYRYIVIVPDTQTWNPISINVYSIDFYGTITSNMPTATPKASPEPTPTAAPTEVPDGYERYDRTGWTASSNSEGQKSSNALDGSETTFWHSNSGDQSFDKTTNPLSITIDMGSVKNIDRYYYLPRPNNGNSGDVNGVCTKFEIQVSNDNEDWTTVAIGTWDYTDNQNERYATFNETSGQYVKLLLRDSMTNANGKYYGSAAEINIGKYVGSAGSDAMTQAKAKIQEEIDKISSLPDSEIKTKLVNGLSALKDSPSATAEGLNQTYENIPSIVNSLSWSTGEINKNYFDRLFKYLDDNAYSSEAFSFVADELNGFNTLGSDVSQDIIADCGLEWCMKDFMKSQTLIERLTDANNRAKEKIADGKADYIMLKELVGYTENCYKEQGQKFYNGFGMGADTCEYITNTINFALDNLEKIQSGEIDTKLNTIKSGEVWVDKLGSKISAHGGQIITGGDGKYYWYGEDNKIGYPLRTGVSCYSSDDMQDWTYEGIAFDINDTKTNPEFASEFMTDSIQGTQGRIERPKVIYNAKNNNYVMWMHLEKNGVYTMSEAGIAVSDSPTGPFTFLHYGYPVIDPYITYNSAIIQALRDMNLFVDDDGIAYVIYSSEANRVPYMVRLNSDYTWIDTDGLNTVNDTSEIQYDETTGMYATGKLYNYNADGTGYVDDDGNAYTPTEEDMKTLTYFDTTKIGVGNYNYTYSKYNYHMPSYCRYQLKSGNAILVRTGTETDRPDKLTQIPTNPNGRFSKVAQNIGNIINNRESPAMIKENGRYYMVGSGISGWKANAAMTLTSTEILGTWTSTGNPMTGDGENASPENGWTMDANPNSSFNSQSTCLVKVPDGSYMYMGDRWKNANYDNSAVGVKNSTYVWLPITFDSSDVLKVTYAKSWIWEIPFGISKVNSENNVISSIELKGTPHSSKLYIATYSNEETLSNAITYDIDDSCGSVMDNINLEIPENGFAKVFLWENNMQPIDVKIIK